MLTHSRDLGCYLVVDEPFTGGGNYLIWTLRVTVNKKDFRRMDEKMHTRVKEVTTEMDR